MFYVDRLILVAGILLLLGIVSSKLSARLGIPVLVLFLLLGMVAGSEGIGGIAFENYPLAHGIGTLALALILFDGGLRTPFTAVRAAWKPSLVLATVGVVITAVVTGLAASWILGLSPLQGMLLGSVVSSTDAAAVFSVLRSGGIGLPKRLSAILEIESGSNDPMAIFLTIGCIELLAQPETGPSALLGLFASQMLLGTVIGITMGHFGARMVNRIELTAAGLYPVLVSTVCLLTFGIAAQLGGSGFLATYLAGMTIGNQKIVFRGGILVYHDALAWFSQIVMFVILGLLSFPSRLLSVSGQAMLIGLVLIFVARPLAVSLSLLPFRMRWRELSLLSWVGLKGAVPITLATFPLMMGTPQAGLLFDVVFFIVVMSALVQGCSLPMVSRWLGLRVRVAPASSVTLEMSSLRNVDGEVVEYSVDERSRASGRKVRELALPDGAVIAMLVRENHIIPPQGGTEVLSGDHVIVVLRPGSRPLVDQVFANEDERRVEIPTSIEFPLRGTTSVGELYQFYDIRIDAPVATTLSDVMRRSIDDHENNVDAVARFGPITLRVRSINLSGEIEMVGMTILSEEEIALYEQQRAVVEDKQRINVSEREPPGGASGTK